MNKIYYPCHSAIFSCCSIVKFIVYNMIILEKLTILQLVPKEFKKKLIEGENTSCKHLGTIKMFWQASVRLPSTVRNSSTYTTMQLHKCFLKKCSYTNIQQLKKCPLFNKWTPTHRDQSSLFLRMRYRDSRHIHITRQYEMTGGAYQDFSEVLANHYPHNQRATSMNSVAFIVFSIADYDVPHNNPTSKMLVFSHNILHLLQTNYTVS